MDLIESDEIISHILSKHKVRFYSGQKKRFRDFIVPEFEKIGFSGQVKVDAAKNIIIGDVDDAEVVYTAHYDTPMFSSYITPFTKIFGHVAGMIVSAVIMATILLFAGILLYAAFYLIFDYGYPGLFFLAFVFFLSLFVPNPNNANDNTSGVAAVFTIAKTLKNQNPSKKTAFILFNNEEWGLVGSGRFSKEYKKRTGCKPSFTVCNLDCVGQGDKLLIVYSPQSKIKAEEIKTAFCGEVIIKKINMLIASDNLRFDNGIMLASVQKPLFGEFYLPKIHMPNDSILDYDILKRICDAAIKISV